MIVYIFVFAMNDERKQYLMIAIAERNDQLAFDELFSFYFPGLVSFVSSILKDKQLAEEVIEDVFIKLWLNRTTMVSIKNFSHYIYTAAKYAAINAIKIRKTVFYDDFGDDMQLTYTSPESILIGHENVRRIDQVINELPPRCRLIFRLIKEEGFKYEEVAQLLQISIKTVESQMRIAISKLTSLLEIMLPDLVENIRQKKV